MRSSEEIRRLKSFTLFHCSCSLDPHCERNLESHQILNSKSDQCLSLRKVLKSSFSSSFFQEKKNLEERFLYSEALLFSLFFKIVQKIFPILKHCKWVFIRLLINLIFCVLLSCSVIFVLCVKYAWKDDARRWNWVEIEMCLKEQMVCLSSLFCVL